MENKPHRSLCDWPDQDAQGRAILSPRSETHSGRETEPEEASIKPASFMFQWQCEDPVMGSQGACYEAPVELKTPRVHIYLECDAVMPNTGRHDCRNDNGSESESSCKGDSKKTQEGRMRKALERWM
ncbi:unnamed protein product [Leuciscus chuanchicus]